MIKDTIDSVKKLILINKNMTTEQALIILLIQELKEIKEVLKK